MGDHPPSRLNWIQSWHSERNYRVPDPPNGAFLSPAAAEEAACIAQDLLTDERIGVGAHHDRSGVAAGRPTDHIARRGVPVHPRRAVGPLREGGDLLPLRALGEVLGPRVVGRGGGPSHSPRRGAYTPREAGAVNAVVRPLAR